jgi:hypothetical protein
LTGWPETWTGPSLKNREIIELAWPNQKPSSTRDKKPNKKPVDFLKKILDQNKIVLICKNVLGQPSDLWPNLCLTPTSD